MEIVKRDLNELLNMTDEGIDELVKTALESSGNADMLKAKKAQLQAAEARLLTIDKMVGKLFMPTTLKAVLMMIDFAEWFRIWKKSLLL